MANIPGTAGNDSLSGTIFDDILNREGDPLSYPGTGGDDYLYGFAGDDHIYGGAGGDILYGGLGNDKLYGGLGPDIMFGDAGDDQIFGGSGYDQLVGGEGNDLLDGGTGIGHDYMEGGNGHDAYIVDDVNDEVLELSNTSLGGVDLVRSSVSYTLGVGLEHLTLTSVAAINGAGNENNNVLIGNAAGNVLLGLEGDDQLFSGEGDDNLIGGIGNDILNGWTGNDVLEGAIGRDEMIGGDGDDLYIVDNEGDKVVELSNNAPGGMDAVYASRTYTLGFGLEHLTLTGTDAINGTGNGNGNTIIGNSASNVLSGLAGDDQLIGNGGKDMLLGGNGNDRLTGASGRDQLNGGAGNDRFDYNAVSESPTGTGRDVIMGFSGTGTALGDQIDLRDIDANTLVSGNQAFTWKGAIPGGAGTLWYTGGVLYGNVDGDATSEFQIQLVGTPALAVGGTGTDILL